MLIVDEMKADDKHCFHCGRDIKRGEMYALHIESMSYYCKDMNCGFRKLCSELKVVKTDLRRLNADLIRAVKEVNSKDKIELLFGEEL